MVSIPFSAVEEFYSFYYLCMVLLGDSENPESAFSSGRVKNPKKLSLK